MQPELCLTHLAALRDLLGAEPAEVVASLARELSSAVAAIERSLSRTISPPQHLRRTRHGWPELRRRLDQISRAVV